MLPRSLTDAVFPPLSVLLPILIAGREVALETWRQNPGLAPPAVELSPPSTVPPPVVAPDPALAPPPGPVPSEPDGLSRRWLDLADWRVWWSYNDDPYLMLKEHIHASGTLSGSDDFFLGTGSAHGGGPYRGPGDSTPPRGPSRPTTGAGGTGGGGGGGGGGPTTPGPAGPASPGGGHYRGPGGSPPPAALPPGSPGSLGGAAGPEPELAPLSPNASPAERERHARLRVERILRSCFPRPGERPSAMYFRFWGDNPFELARLDPQSTFGVDVDTASYALARRYLTQGMLPERAQIRTEEFVNYFRGDVPPPRQGTFALRTELAPSRFGADPHGAYPARERSGERWMLRVALRGREVAREERQPLSLTFVVDTSGSMASENRLELVKHALRLLVAQLDARDSIALVRFSSDAGIVLRPTAVADRARIEQAIESLSTAGSTNAEAGLVLGYELARTTLSAGALSRVVFLSDGVANVGQTNQDRLNEQVRRHREAGIFLNTVGVGLGNHNDALLEQLADRGDGVCNYVDSPLEARRALVDNFTGAMVPIARDVKIQVEFDPEQVFRYRLLGYENRAIADAAFRDDAVDAGEVGAGHQVVALYELELHRTTDAPLCAVRLRWKQPVGAGRDPLEDQASEFEAPVHFRDATSWEGSSLGYQRSVLVAQLAELLRRSTHAEGDTLEELAGEALRLDRHAADPDFTEFLAMIERGIELTRRAPREPDPLERCVDALRRQRYVRAQCETARIGLGREEELELERTSRELEARIRELVREGVRDQHR